MFAAVVIGIPVGILMGKNRFLDELLLPWVNIFLSAPLTALVPVLMVLFGFGMKAIIITTTLFAIWIIILNARAGVMQINRSLVDMGRSFGATPWAAFSKIYFWAALPEILGGVRIGVIRAVKGVIIGQLLISIVGFGALFELYSANFLMSHFWAVPDRSLRSCIFNLRGTCGIGAPVLLLRCQEVADGGVSDRIGFGLPSTNRRLVKLCRHRATGCSIDDLIVFSDAPWPGAEGLRECVDQRTVIPFQRSFATDNGCGLPGANPPGQLTLATLLQGRPAWGVSFASGY